MFNFLFLFSFFLLYFCLFVYSKKNPNKSKLNKPRGLEERVKRKGRNNFVLENVLRGYFIHYVRQLALSFKEMKKKINTIQSQRKMLVFSVLYVLRRKRMRRTTRTKSCEYTKAIKNFFTVLWLLFLFIHSLIITNESINLAYNKNNEL